MNSIDNPPGNPGTAQFERSIEAAAGPQCTSCGMALPVGARFCLNCGQPVNSRAFTDSTYLINLAAAAPEPLIEKVRAASFLTGERRLVTAVFVDIVNSTAIMAKVGSAGWRAIMNNVCDWFCSVIYRYEGTIARIVGDELLAFFGAPVAHEDDPVRAVHAALDILEAVKTRAAEIKREFDVDFEVRISLSTGPVTIGPVSSDLQFEYSALQGTLNLAAQLEATKRAMAVLISAETYRLVAPFFEFQDLGPVHIDEKNGLVPLYQVTGAKADLGPSRRLVHQKSPLVGRNSELHALLALSEALSAGLGRAVLIMGESGLGKTRLVVEWQTAVAQVPTQSALQWASGLCLSYNQSTAYSLLRDLLRSLLGISKTAGEPETRAALHSAAEELFGDSAPEVYPFLGHLLAVKLDDDAQARIAALDPPALQAQYTAACRRLFLVLADLGPLVLLLEDLQWADPSSIAILSRLLSLAATAPILFCLVTRPERDTTGWKLVMASREILGGRFSQLRLGLLAEAESRQIIQNLLQIDALPENVFELILKKTEGNPLFIEEMLHMLIERRLLKQQNGGWAAGMNLEAIGIPDNLQGLLLARLERLSDETRQILRVAAIIGRRFSVPVLEKVSGQRGMTLLNHLGSLESNGSIEVFQVKPELTYRFQNTLFLDALYASILPPDRARLHLAVGSALEQLYTERREQLAPQLARHFLEGGAARTALDYYSLAGEIALKASANQEAEGRFRQALALDPERGQKADLLYKLGQALFWQSRFQEAIQIWHEAIPVFQDLGDLDGLTQIYALSARALWSTGDTPGSLQLCLDGLGAAAGAPESPGLALLLHEAARAHLFNGQPGAARRLGEQALAMAEHLGDPVVQSESLATLGLLQDQTPEEALAALDEAAELAESAGLLSQAARAHVNLAALMATALPDFPAACRHYRRAAELQRLRGNTAGELLGLGGMSGVLIEMGQFTELEATLPVMQALLDELADPGPHAFHMHISAALLHRFRGQLGEAFQQLTAMQEAERRRGNLQNLGDINIDLAEVILESHLLLDQESFGTWNEAEAALDEAVAIWNRWSRPGIKPRCLLSMVYTAQGRLQEARRSLSAAYERLAPRPIAQDEAWPELAAARLAVAEKRWISALDFYAAAAEIFGRLGMPWLRARVLLERAQAQIAHKEPTDLEQARAQLQEVSAAFAAMGSLYYQKLAQDHLQNLEKESYAQAVAHQRVEEEMAAAGRIQIGLLPDKPPPIPGYQLAAALDPSRQTSGDFYDFISLGAGLWGLVIADVADKGLAAALFMALSGSLIRTYAVGNQTQPERVLGETNRRILADTHTDLFVTMFYAVLNPQTGVLSYANAGHNPPYLFKEATGRIIALDRTGIPVGILEDSTWAMNSVQLDPGDVLVLYTDGITDALDREGAFFSAEKLQETIKANCLGTADDIQEAILQAIHQFAGSVPQFDDITLVVLKREAENNAGD